MKHITLIIQMLLLCTTTAYAEHPHQYRIDQRIQDLHNKLSITNAQEEYWRSVAQAMTIEAQTIDALIQDRLDATKTRTALDDITSYHEIIEAHANGIKEFYEAFKQLYTALTEEQRKQADQLFRNGRWFKNKNAHAHRSKRTHKQHKTDANVQPETPPTKLDYLEPIM